jgi:hypothetical protein
MDPTLITACQMFLVPRHLAHASRRGQMEAAGFLDMSVEMLDRVYGHHHPDYLRSAARLIGYRRRETVPISVPVTLPTPGPATQAIEIMSGPGRARTSNQTVMSGRKHRTLSKNREFSMIFMHRRECSDGCFWGETGAVTRTSSRGRRNRRPGRLPL